MFVPFYIAGNELFGVVIYGDDMFCFFDKRNLIYGDWFFLFQALSPPYVIIALGDYHDGSLLDVSQLAFSSDEVFYVPAHNKSQFRVALKQSMSLDIPILILNIERLFRIEDYSLLNFLMHDALNMYDNALFITAGTMKSKRYPPPPLVPHYIRHMVDVVIFSRRTKNAYALYLIKHPFLPFSKFIWRCDYGKEFSLLSFLSAGPNNGYQEDEKAYQERGINQCP